MSASKSLCRLHQVQLSPQHHLAVLLPLLSQQTHQIPHLLEATDKAVRQRCQRSVGSHQLVSPLLDSKHLPQDLHSVALHQVYRAHSLPRYQLSLHSVHPLKYHLSARQLSRAQHCLEQQQVHLTVRSSVQQVTIALPQHVKYGGELKLDEHMPSACNITIVSPDPSSYLRPMSHTIM